MEIDVWRAFGEWRFLYYFQMKDANFFFDFYAQKKSEFCKQNSKEYYLHK